MKDKFAKLRSVIKKYGVWGAFKKVCQYINAEVIHSISIVSNMKIRIHKKEYINQIQDILKKSKYDRIIIWRSSFGWNVPLFQRPQHISNNLSKQKCLVFYEVTKMTDQVEFIEKLQNNLYLVNFKNKLFCKLLMQEISKINKPKYLQFYSTDWTLPVSYVKEQIANGYKVIYEYIDDLSPLLAGTKELPVNVKEKYEYAMQDTENVLVVVTADLLKEDVIKQRGEKNLAFSTNGVDYQHFQKIDQKYPFEREFQEILDKKLPIVCYYGALASWFDYELIKKLSQTGQYSIVLFGIKYDDAYEKAGLDQCPNVYFLGSRDYQVLKNYAAKADVLTIPFLINDITKATSPVKIFEYMALHKPIVTTAMHECMKYKSVFIGKDHQDFIRKIGSALEMQKDKKYLKLLDQEARENDWSEKAKAIVEMLKVSEKK